jgi:hypothetical protein
LIYDPYLRPLSEYERGQENFEVDSAEAFGGLRQFHQTGRHVLVEGKDGGDSGHHYTYCYPKEIFSDNQGIDKNKSFV